MEKYDREALAAERDGLLWELAAQVELRKQAAQAELDERAPDPATEASLRARLTDVDARIAKGERRALAAERDVLMAQLAAQAELASGATPGIGGKHDAAMVSSLQGRLEEVNRQLTAG
jgi:hypothetical protein